MATRPFTLVQVIRAAQDAALQEVQASLLDTTRGLGAFRRDSPETRWHRLREMYISRYNDARADMGFPVTMAWTEGPILARHDKRLWDLMGLPRSHPVRVADETDHQMKIPPLLVNLVNSSPSTTSAILTMMSDDWLTHARNTAGIGYMYMYISDKLRVLEFLDAELVRRAESRERRIYEQANVAGALENRYVASAGTCIPAAIQQLVGSFLHNIGTAPLGHPTRLPIVPPRPIAAAAQPQHVGATRKAAASEAASSHPNKRSKPDDVD